MKGLLKYRLLRARLSQWWSKSNVQITSKTRNNKTVHIPCEQNLVGEFVNVKISGAKTWYLKGELI